MDSQILKQKVSALDGMDYGSYQSLTGDYAFDLFRLIVQQIPKDPYAPPHAGIYRIRVSRSDPRILCLNTETRIQRIACADFLARRFFEAAKEICKGHRGTGFSGVITINEPGQAVLERNCVVISDDAIEIRCFLGLPARGRRIVSTTAQAMLLEELPEIVAVCLRADHVDHEGLARHIAVTQDAEFLRRQLEPLGLVAFVADHAILPRESAISDKPLSGPSVIPFAAPDSLSITIELPHAGMIRGMGIPKGITLITGGGYHGKSTVLSVLERGIYNHIPGDGREQCVSHPQAVKIRAYDGRSIARTDISSFLKNLPFNRDTRAFSTDNASGSTSQAATIVEAIEAGGVVFMMDEDTCATNFMIRDIKMQQLVDSKDEPITAFIDKVRQLYTEMQISTILVIGGVGDYFDVSDVVIQMNHYQARDRTVDAHRIAAAFPAKRTVAKPSAPFLIRHRMPRPDSIDPVNAQGKFTVRAMDTHRLLFGKQIMDLTDLEQLIELSQTKALGFAMEYAKKFMDQTMTLREIVETVARDMDARGLDVLSERLSGHFALFRPLELAFALNRLRGLEMVQKTSV